MVKKIEIVLPTEFEEKWETLKSILKLGDEELAMKLIETELRIMRDEEHIEVFEKTEEALQEVEEIAGIEGLKEFANNLQLIVEKIKEVVK